MDLVLRLGLVPDRATTRTVAGDVTITFSVAGASVQTCAAAANRQCTYTPVRADQVEVTASYAGTPDFAPSRTATASVIRVSPIQRRPHTESI